MILQHIIWKFYILHSVKLSKAYLAISQFAFIFLRCEDGITITIQSSTFSPRSLVLHGFQCAKFSFIFACTKRFYGKSIETFSYSDTGNTLILQVKILTWQFKKLLRETIINYVLSTHYLSERTQSM